MKIDENNHGTVLKEGQLFRYSAGLLSQGGAWKDVRAVLNEDSTFRVYRDEQRNRKEFEVRLDGVVLFLAFGRAATKYGPPMINIADQKKVDVGCLMAVPHSKMSESITWFAAPNLQELEQWIRAMAKAVDGKARPPKLGKKPVADKIMAGLRETVQLNDKPLEWELYWLATSLTVDHELNSSTVVAVDNEEPATTTAWRNQLVNTTPGEVHSITHESTNLEELNLEPVTSMPIAKTGAFQMTGDAVTSEAVTAAE
ncbi:unnamed protein product [Soboliphyme baturini]|uniref:PH domain-containing protein n=1 Tax=Soboliphyme baturini TaxID=241478 RepID=A0A183J0T4_9BILA|nr:unnamed protein product [Soboliphyme baturini]